MESDKMVIDEYYNLLGIVQNNSRKREQVQARAAMMVALKKFKTCSAVGRLFGMDHATVVHHCKNHAGNMATWDGYHEKYDVAEAMCAKNITHRTVQAKLDSIRNEIQRLQEVEKIMMSKVKGQLKSSENE